MEYAIVFLHTFSDGGGDFAYGENIINLLKKHIKVENIYLVIIATAVNSINAFKNLITKYKINCIDKLKKCEGECTPIDYDMENVIQMIYKAYCDETNDIIGYYDKNICNNMFEKPISKPFTDEPTLKNLLNTLKVESDICYIEKTHIRIAKSHLIGKQFFERWVPNSLRLINNTKLNKENIQIINNYMFDDFITKYKPNNLINNKNCLIITYIYKTKYLQETYNNYIFLDLTEGGNNAKYYNTGFNADNKYKLGIKVVSKEQLESINLYDKQKLSIKNIENNKYNVCYFGSITNYISINSFLMLMKLKILIDLLHELNKATNIIFLNKVAYDFIIKNKEYVIDYFKNIVSNITDDSIVIDNIKIRYYEKLTQDEFLYFLQNSDDLCFATGDHSFFEAISLGKNVLYDILPWKIILNKEIFDLFLQYLKEKNKIINIPQIQKDFIELLYVDKEFQSINDLIQMDLINETKIDIIHQKNGQIEYKTLKYEIKPQNYNITIKITDPVSFIEFNFNKMKNYYKFIMCYSKIILEDYEDFYNWLDTNWNFEKKLEKILQEKMCSVQQGGDYYLQKYNKYKTKYLQLKKSN